MSNPNISYQSLQEELKHWLNDSSLIQKDVSENLYASLMQSHETLAPGDQAKLESARERYENGTVNRLLLSLDFLAMAWKSKDFMSRKNLQSKQLKDSKGKDLQWLARVKALQDLINQYVSSPKNPIIWLDWYIQKSEQTEKSFRSISSLEQKNTELSDEITTQKGTVNKHAGTIKNLREATLTKWWRGKYSAIGRHIFDVENSNKDDNTKMWLTLAFATRIRGGINRTTTLVSREFLKLRSTKEIRERINKTVDKINTEIAATKDAKKKAGLQYIFDRLEWASKHFDKNIVPKRVGEIDQSKMSTTQQTVESVMKVA